MDDIKIKTALISVYYKDGLDEIVHLLAEQGVKIFTTGGTQSFIESLGIKVEMVEELTGYPSILDGRVKTLHPKVFGGILAKSNEDHQQQLVNYDIPNIDLVIVDLYPFEETVKNTLDESTIIEKIDIGGISLIRAAAKNFENTVVIPSRAFYANIKSILLAGGVSTIQDRKHLAAYGFMISSHYDTTIFNYLSDQDQKKAIFKCSESRKLTLRYGENPHQNASFFGEINEVFHQISGKELSYNNLVDVDAAINLIAEFDQDKPSFVIIKHTNACGVASRNSGIEAWKGALACDSTSAFGGIIITNVEVDLELAAEIDKIFYEVLMAPSYTTDALALLSAKNKRTILKLNKFRPQVAQFKSLLNGVILQDVDNASETIPHLVCKTQASPTENQLHDLIFALKCAKHLKSNTIVLAKDKQMIGMGCGQTSRIDACRQAIDKAKHFGFDLKGAVMASDAFFPFPDCVELGKDEGISAVVQPGGSIKDQLSIDYCNMHGLAMVFTGIRHFKH